MKRVAKTRQWAKAQRSDPFVKQAKAEGWRSRAALKLLAIQQKQQLLKPGMRVLDLGAAPGSWSQVASRAVHPGGKVIAIDRLSMAPMPGVRFIQGDILEGETLDALDLALADLPVGGQAEAAASGQVDVLLSDMAPNITGIVDVDHQGWLALTTMIMQVIEKKLKIGGTACVKLFHNGVFRGQRQAFVNCFKRVQIIKPEASRAQSREVYLFARDYQGIMDPK